MNSYAARAVYSCTVPYNIKLYTALHFTMFDYGVRVAAMVHAALFISPSSSCETARIFVCNCIYISMSYHYSKYEFVGPESDLERYSFRSSSSSSLLVCLDGIFRRRL